LIDFKTGETIRDFSNDNPESILSGSFSTVLGIAFSHDGKLMASGGFANDQGIYFARLWEVETGKEIRRFVHSKRSYGIPSLAFSPDSKTLATRSHDGRLRLFDVETGKERRTFPKDGGGRRLGSVTFAPDGKTVAAAGDSIRLYDVKTGEERLRIDRKQASHLYFTDGGKTLTGAVMGAIYRWDTATGKLLTPQAGDSVVEQILVSPDGRRVVTRGQRSDAHIWDGTNGKHLRRFRAAWQRGLAMSPDGRFLVWPVEDESIHFPDPHNPRVSYDGSRIGLYDIAAGNLVDRFPAFEGDADDLTFINDGRKLVTVDHRDGMVRIWNVEAGKLERSFQAVPDAESRQSPQVRQTSLSPDGKTLAMAYHAMRDEKLLESTQQLIGRPRPLRLWDVTTGKVQRQLDQASGAMAFSPDGQMFVTSSRIVWETATGNRIAALPDRGYIRALAFSRDGRFLATAVPRGVIQLWDVATWTKRKEFKGHRDRPTTLTFTPGGQLLSGSADTTVLAWDLQ
jgi:WD40 repeat protein